MGLFDRAGGLFGRNKGGAEEFYAQNNNKAPDFLGRDRDGGLFGGFGSAQENTTPSVAESTTPATPAAPNMDFGGGGGSGMFGGIVPDQGGEATIGPMYPAIPDNGDPNSPFNKTGDNSPGRIPSDQSDPYPQQQMPFFGMQNPMSNMFGMGQAMNPYMGGMGGGMFNPMMSMMGQMMNPFMGGMGGMGGGMFNPMMMGMMNPFMNPFAMMGGMGGMGGMFGGMGGALGNMFGRMPQMQMPRRPMQRERNNFQDGPISGGGRFGGRIAQGIRAINDGRFGGSDYYTDLNPGSGSAFMAIEPGYRNGQKGYYTDSSRNTFVVDDQYGPRDGRFHPEHAYRPGLPLRDLELRRQEELLRNQDRPIPHQNLVGGLGSGRVSDIGYGNTYDGPDYGPADTIMYTQDMPAAGNKYVYDQQGRRHEVPNYRMTPEDNMMIQDNSDPQGEAEAEAYVMQMINDPIYGADIMRSLNTMF